MNTALVCPYCDRPLRWVPHRWFGRGCFECDQCGEFPDLRDTVQPHNVPVIPEQDVRRPPKRDERPRVLLVDDSAEHCDLYALMLEPTATVVTATRGLEALKIAASEALDAIVLDVLMPGMDGWEVCSRLKSSPLTSDIPVILLTSLDGEGLRARAEQAGAEAVLVKPCAAERLALAIDAAVRGRIKPFLQSTRRPDFVFQNIAAAPGTQTRRWTRKPVKIKVTARLDSLPAQLRNISYGGMCIEVERSSGPIPLTFNVTFPTTHLSVHAGTVWTCRAPGGWLCGAEVSQGTDSWRGLVDRIS